MIGTLTARQVAAGRGEVDVVTGDRDLFQLADDAARVRVLYVGRGVRKLEMVDEAWLSAKYGVTSGPMYAEMATLRGDPSDGLPGVAGIGEKTASGLLKRFGSLSACAQPPPTPPPTSPPGSARSSSRPRTTWRPRRPWSP